MQSLTSSMQCGNTSDYALKADLIQNNIALLWNAEDNMFFAGEIDNRLNDVWGSLFAVSLELVDSATAQLIVDTVVANASKIFQSGQVRHLVFPQVWDRCVHNACPAPGTYQ